MRVPLAGADAAGHPTETLLSEVGLVLLRFFDTREACTLRLVCREFTEAVRVQQWEDRTTVIQGSLAAWRACFPRARCASVRKGEWNEGFRRAPLKDADFAHFQGLRELDMTDCEAVSAAAFVHLRGIHTLDMSGCLGVTDAAFVHLRGIHTLKMGYCTEITDAALVHLRGIHTLVMIGCSRVTDAGFAHLAGIQRLCMAACRQAALSDAAFVHLRGIKVLRVNTCTQLTDAAFAHLRGIHTLLMAGCTQLGLSDAAFAPLAGGIHTLVMSNCSQPTISGASLALLTGVRRLAMAGCAPEAVAAAQGAGLPVSTEHCTWLEEAPFACKVGKDLWD
jgi:hypothetical protein